MVCRKLIFKDFTPSFYEKHIKGFVSDSIKTLNYVSRCLATTLIKESRLNIGLKIWWVTHRFFSIGLSMWCPDVL